MNYTVNITHKAQKNIDKLPEKVRGQAKLLIKDIEVNGPVRGNWSNYGKLSGNMHHCHIKKGRPTYVAVWEEKDKTIKLIEVVYIGTHEKAPY